MKRVISEVSGKFGMDSLLGEKVLLLCGNYFYHGTLVGVNKTIVELDDASIVYETGEWGASAFKDLAEARPWTALRPHSVDRGFSSREVTR